MQRFSDLLDVQAYDQRTGAFICSSDYLGYIWQTEPLSYVNEDLERQLKSLLHIELPDNSYLSLTLVADDNLTSYYREYMAVRTQRTQVRAINQSTEARLEFLRQMQQGSKDIQAPCSLRNYILLVSLKLACKGSPTQPLLTEYQQYAAQIGAALEATFGRATHKLDACGYLFVMRNLLLHKDYLGLAQQDPIFNFYDSEQTLATQIFTPSSSLHVHQGALELDGSLAVVFTPLEIPQSFACGQAVNYLGDLLSGMTPLTSKFLITCNLFFPNSAKSRAWFENKRNLTIRQSMGRLARFLTRLGQTTASFDLTAEDLNTGDRLVKLSWTLVAWLPTTQLGSQVQLAPPPPQVVASYGATPAASSGNVRVVAKPSVQGQEPAHTQAPNYPNQAPNQETAPTDSRQQLLQQREYLAQRLAQAQAFAVKVKSYFQTTGWLLDNETLLQLPVFLNALPLGVEHQATPILQRYRTLSTTQAVVCLPCFAEWKATARPVVPLISRTGQLMNFDLFASQTNFNCCIAAQSGSGKSFLVNEIVANLLATGAQCWIIDIGRSYRKLAQVYHGEFIEFSEHAQININPFALVQDYVQDADMLFTLIQAMLSPKDQLSEYQANALKQIIKNLWDAHGTQLNIDLLERTLAQHADPRLRDLAIQMFPYTSQGAYGGYFNDSDTNMISMLAALEKQQQEQTSSKSRLVVLELEELSGRKDLQQLVLLELIFAINQQMINGERARQKVLFIDEAWDLLASKTISHFIETGYRRFRKYNGAVVTITQSLEDLYNSTSGRAIAANSANYLFLAQKTETIQQLLQQHKLVLDAGAINQITSLRTRKGHYSEIFCMTDYGFGVGRLIVDRALQLLYSTNAIDIAELEALEQRYQVDLWTAIQLKLGRLLPPV